MLARHVPTSGGHPAPFPPTGNSNENTKALFKDRLKARTTPSFFFIREGASSPWPQPALGHGSLDEGPGH